MMSGTEPVYRRFAADRLNGGLSRSNVRLQRLTLLLTIILGGCLPISAHAQAIENQIAVFAGLDKITATITKIEVPVNKTARFGALRVTPRICNTRPPTEPPKTTAFVEVAEIRLDGAPKQIFNGWMFAASPGLHGVEHPVYDVWLTSCKTPAPSRSPRKR